jgi:hypothetical protein
MAPERSNSTSYKERAAIYAWRAELVDSAEAAAALLYLEQVWIFIADVAVQLREKDRTPRSAATLTI